MWFVWHGLCGMVCYRRIHVWFVVWCGMVWYGVVLCGMVWVCVVWHEAAWCGMVLCGMV